MSEIPNTITETTPSQDVHLDEITGNNVIYADAEQLTTAVNTDIERIQTSISQVEHGGVEWNNLREQLTSAGVIAQHVRQYKSKSQLGGAQGFMQFLTEKMADADEVDDLDKYEAYQKTEDWILEQAALSDGGTIGNVLRSELYGSEQSANQRIEPPLDENDTEVVLETEDTAKIEAKARSSIEDIFENELFENIVQHGKNRTQLNADVKLGFSFIGDGPSSGNTLLDFNAFMQLYNRDNKASDWRDELNEMVLFTNVMERDFQEVTTTRESKGRFGRTERSEYTTKEPVPGSEHPKMIRNEITGEDEPLVVFNYKFSLRSYYALNAEELPKYQEFGGQRGGQAVAVGLELPKSLAETLQAQITRDPSSVRTLVEKLFLENSNGEMSAEHWQVGREDVKHAVRPPYEKLPEDWTIAVVENTVGGDNQEYSVERLVP